MANQIRLKRASGSDPGASDLVTGEVAVRTDNGKLFTKKDDGNVVEVAGGISDGDKGDITVSNSGATFTIDSGVIDNANIASDAAISASKISGVMPTAGGTFTGNVSISDNAIEFDSDSGNTNKVSLQGPSSLSGNITLTLPNTDGDSGQALLTDGSGNLSFGTDFGSQTITTTGNFNCSSLTASNGANINNQILINGVQAQILFIESDANPDYTIRGQGGILDFRDSTSDVSRMSIQADGQVDIEQKLNCQGGLDTDGDVKFNSGTTNMNILFDASQQSLEFDDSVKATFGFDKDLQVYHDSSDSFIAVEGTGGLVLSSNAITIKNKARDENQAVFTANSTVQLYNDNVVRLTTTTSGITVSGTATVTGNIFPESDSSSDIGTTSVRFANGFFDNLYGSGANITALNGSNISSGTVAAARVATLNQDTTGTAAIATTVTVADESSDTTCFPLFATAATGNLAPKSGSNLSFNSSNGTLTATSFSGDGSSVTNVDADTLDGIDSGSFIRSDANDTVSGDITFAGGAAAVVISGGSDLRFTNGDWTGNVTKIQHNSNRLYIVGGSDGIMFREDGTDRWHIDGSGHFDPQADSTYDIGSSSVRVRNGYFDTLYGDGSNLTGISAGLPTSGGELTGDLITHNVRPDGNGTRSLGTDSFRWSNVFTSDLHLSNKAKGANQIDNTWGDFTIQEGANDLYLINNRNGKMFKFLLAEVK